MSKKIEQKPELNAKMHASLLEADGLSYKDTMVLGAYSKVLKGIPKEEACKAYDISVSYYDENIERVLES